MATSKSSSERAELERGLELIDGEAYFEAHEVLEDLWRAAPANERDFFQGLVHVAVAWHHARGGNRPGFERQLAKARRRLAPYAPAHNGVDIEHLLGQIDAASFPPLARVRIKRS
jgi:predicted metal-dependent hydrolase